jgi:hypothetical protein
MALFIVLLTCTPGGVRPAAAAVAVDISVGGNPLVAPSPESVVGWEFSTSQPIRLTHMGVYDDGGDGLRRPWKINLWRLDQSQSTISVEVGTGDPSESLVGAFRYHESVVSINPVVNGPVLDPGRYVIAAGGLTFDESDRMPRAVASLTTDPAITFLQARSGMNSFHNEDLVFPDVIEPGPNYFGPNFQFVAVPEPPAVISAACGLVVILTRARRLRR